MRRNVTSASTIAGRRDDAWMIYDRDEPSGVVYEKLCEEACVNKVRVGHPVVTSIVFLGRYL